MNAFTVTFQQTDQGRFYASTEVKPSRFIFTWGYTMDEAKNWMKQAEVEVELLLYAI